jgi:hypothetical protein
MSQSLSGSISLLLSIEDKAVTITSSARKNRVEPEVADLFTSKFLFANLAAWPSPDSKRVEH